MEDKTDKQNKEEDKEEVNNKINVIIGKASIEIGNIIYIPESKINILRMFLKNDIFEGRVNNHFINRLINTDSLIIKRKSNNKK